MADTPFWRAMARLAQEKARFHVPGHKGNPAAIPPLGGLLRYDMTEIAGADDLSCPTGPLLESQRAMARLYGSGATLYSASGSTSCIQAMLTLFVKPGEPVVMARGCHVAAARALAFLNANPVWVLPEDGRPRPADVEAALRQSGAKVVYVTSPDYEGRMADISALRAVCDRFGAKLLVDNAHGAHLRFLQPDSHPIALGVDAAADSAHKTLPCLTPAALLHLRDGALAEEARQALNLYSSTSPSYLVLESLDLAAGLLATERPDFDGAARRLAEVAAAIPHMAGNSDDPLKLCLYPALGGRQAAEVNAALEAAGIYPELADARRIVLMASPWNTPTDFAMLRAVLEPFGPKAPLPLPQEGLLLPPVAMPVRTALFGPKRRVLLEEAEGRVMAGLSAPCPPGVPLVLPGEVITGQAREIMALGGISAVDVVK